MGEDFKEGVRDGLPVFLGYFPTAVAFGLLARNSSFEFVHAMLMSITNYAGAGQFLAINLYNASSTLISIVVAVFFLNSRYMFMASSLSMKVERGGSVIGRIMCGFATTDEQFAIASFKGRVLSHTYIGALWITMYLGWVSGTAVGYAAGTLLPPVLQNAAMITCYAMFASILGTQASLSGKALIVAFVSASINTVMRMFVSPGISFLVAMGAASLFGAILYTDEEAGL